MTKKSYPKTIGACLDRLWTVNQRRLEIYKQHDELKKTEDELRQHIINTFTKDNLSSAKGRHCSVTVVTQEVPTIEDWDAFYAFAKRKGNDDLLAKRVATPAWRQRLADHKAVPGVVPYTRVSLRLNRLKK